MRDADSAMTCRTRPCPCHALRGARCNSVWQPRAGRRIHKTGSENRPAEGGHVDLLARCPPCQDESSLFSSMVVPTGDAECALKSPCRRPWRAWKRLCDRCQGMLRVSLAASDLEQVQFCFHKQLHHVIAWPTLAGQLRIDKPEKQ